MPLFATVFHVWGKLNRTFTRGAETGGLLDYFDQYVKWDDPSKPNYLQVGFRARASARIVVGGSALEAVGGSALEAGEWGFAATYGKQWGG